MRDSLTISGRGLRPVAALAVSLACHASALLLLSRGWSWRGHERPPIVVTMLERGAEGGAGGGDERAAAPPGPAAAPAPPPAVPLAPPPLPKPRVVAARAQPARAVAPRATRPPAPAVPAARDAAAPTVATAADGAGAGGGSGAAAGAGSGAGDRGHGTGTGSGGDGAGDGLRAYCRACPAPDYPSRARRQGWQGTVDVELRIAADGGVETAHVGTSSGYPALDDAALASARRSRFALPADGRGLGGRLRYRFVLDETAARR